MIKKIVFWLLFSAISFAQNQESKSTEKTVKFEETFRIYYVIPNQIGNHSLAKDYENRFGFGSKLTLVSIKNFNLGFGGEYVAYTITDKSSAGNFSKGNYKNAFFLVNYPIPISSKFTINSNAAIGVLEFTQRENQVRQSHQNGTNFRLGMSTDYELGKEVDVFFGIDYIYTKFKLNANPEIIDYFGKSNNLQFTIGFNFKSPKQY